MVNLAKQSLFDCPPIASSILAPMDVPQRKICFDKTYSFSDYRDIGKVE